MNMDKHETDFGRMRMTAAQWFVELTGRTVDDVTEAQFADWLRSDSRNEIEFARCEAAVHLTNKLRLDGDLRWAFVEARQLASRQTRRSTRVRLSPWYQKVTLAWGVAATFAAIAVLALVVRDWQQPPTEISDAPVPSQLALAVAWTDSEPAVLLPGHIIVDAHSLAVLPFVSGSGSGTDHAPADGLAMALHSEVVRQLAAIPGLYVIERGSVVPYKGLDILPGDVAAQLGVRGIVEGSVVSTDETIRVVVRFFDAANRSLLLENAYEGPVGETTDIESNIVTNIAVALANSPRDAGQPISHQ